MQFVSINLLDVTFRILLLHTRKKDYKHKQV